jgi:hypothetical protein
MFEGRIGPLGTVAEAMKVSQMTVLGLRLPALYNMLRANLGCQLLLPVHQVHYQ